MIDTQISIFKSIYDVSNPYNKPVYYFLDRIKNGSPATEKVLEYRKTGNDEIKKMLPACTFSGTFTHRNSQSLAKFSQFACLDFDKFEGLTDAQQMKDNLCADECLFCCFISPSGKGVKAVFRLMNDPQKYEAMYRALCMKYTDAHLDSKTKDISRLCYESYDPDIYINDNANEWNLCEEEGVDDVGHVNNKVTVPLRAESRIIDNLQKWFDRKYSMVPGKRNENIWTFAIMLNKFGVNSISAESHLMRYAENGFTSKEIKATVKSAYKKFSYEFNSRAFEDYETTNQIKDDVNKGKKATEIIRQLKKDNNPISNNPDEFEEILENIRATEDSDIFWKFSENGKISLVPHKYDLYLKKNNFFKYYPESNQDTFIFVQMDSNLIEVTTKDKIKDFVLNDLRTRENLGFSPFDYMASNTKFFTNEFLNMLQAVDIEIKRDTKDQCFLYFKNCVVEVGRDYTKQIEYIDIDKYVWKKTVIDRDYKNFDHHKSEFRSFLWFIAGQNRESYNSFKSAIGYLLHTYKTTADNKAVILNDEVISDTPNGRSGKGLFFTALKHLKKVDTIDGKDFSFEKNFKFQTVSTDCQVLVFDDVKRNFEFERLFSIITEGIEIEYKNQGTIKLPVEKSPKIVITTNYTIKGEGGSFDARKYELELSSHFNKDYTPVDQFGHRLFDNWDGDEWSRFDNFMIQCIQYYLNFGLQKQHHKNLEVRKFMTETSNDFYEWTQDPEKLKPDVRLYNQTVYNDFIEEYPDYKNKLQIKTFKKWVKMYCEHKKYTYMDGNTNGMRYFYLSSISQKNIEIKEEFPF